MVKLDLPHDEVQLLTRDRRYLFVDLVGTIGNTLSHYLLLNVLVDKSLVFPGGNLGLFLGLSILSLVEVAFWIVKIVSHLVFRKKKPFYGLQQ